MRNHSIAFKISQAVLLNMLFLVGAASIADIESDSDNPAPVLVKWIDEYGRVHFGDKAPPKYQAQSEIVKLREITVVAPEQEIRDKNKRQARQYRHQDSNARKRLNDKKRNKPLRSNDSGRSSLKKLSRADCRDSYPNNTPKRTACFKLAKD